MIGYMRRHEKYVQETRQKDLDAAAIKELLHYHDKHIQWMQQERLAHLVTMLCVCLFTLLALGFTIIIPTLPAILLCTLLTALTLAYVIHYYRLENGIQKWYTLSDEIGRNNKLQA